MLVQYLTELPNKIKQRVFKNVLSNSSVQLIKWNNGKNETENKVFLPDWIKKPSHETSVHEQLQYILFMAFDLLTKKYLHHRT